MSTILKWTKFESIISAIPTVYGRGASKNRFKLLQYHISIKGYSDLYC